LYFTLPTRSTTLTCTIDPKNRPGGLTFPGEQSPKQRDFAYFAFTVGTSFAVSDVDVTDGRMRQAVLGHEILSFFYNTSILATVVSMATG
jgi:uncharacterized membrane protein